MFHSAVDMKSLLVAAVILFFESKSYKAGCRKCLFNFLWNSSNHIVFFKRLRRDQLFSEYLFISMPVFYSLDQVVKGKTLLVNLTNQYGLYPHFLEPFFQIIRLNSFTYSLTFFLTNHSLLRVHLSFCVSVNKRSLRGLNHIGRNSLSSCFFPY